MRVGSVAVVAALAASRPALGDPPAPLTYPEAYVDRPLLLYSGMTELEVDEQLDSTPTSRFSDRTPDVYARHDFGPVEVFADLGFDAELGVRFDTGAVPAVVSVTAVSGAPQPDGDLYESQVAALEHKLHLAPRRFAIAFVADVALSENRAELDGTKLWTHVVSASADVEPEVQLLLDLALRAYGVVTVPLVQSSSQHFVASAFVGAELVLTLGHWDLFAEGEVDDVTGERLPAVAFGVVHRWGG